CVASHKDLSTAPRTYVCVRQLFEKLGGCLEVPLGVSEVYAGRLEELTLIAGNTQPVGDLPIHAAQSILQVLHFDMHGLRCVGKAGDLLGACSHALGRAL